LSFHAGGRDQGIVRGYGDLDTIAIGITEPQCIACLWIAIALSKGQFDIRLLETSSQRGKISIGVKFESYVMEARSLRRGARTGSSRSCLAKQAQAVMFTA